MKKFLSLLLVLTICASLVACGNSSPEEIVEKYLIAKEKGDVETMSRFDVISNKDKHEASISKLVQSNDSTYEEVEKSIFESASEEYGTTIKSLKDLNKAIQHTATLKLKEYYGKDYSMSITVLESKEYSAEEVSAMEESVLEEYSHIQGLQDKLKFEKGMAIKTKISYSSKNIEENEEKVYSLSFGFVNGKWKVVDAVVLSDDTGYGKPKDGTELVLEGDLKEEIEDEVWGNYYKNFCLIMFNKLYSDVNITDFQKTAVRQTNDYTITVFGKLYFKNNYGDNVYTNVQIVYTAKANRKEENGYEILRDFKVDTD